MAIANLTSQLRQLEDEKATLLAQVELLSREVADPGTVDLTADIAKLEQANSSCHDRAGDLESMALELTERVEELVQDNTSNYEQAAVLQEQVDGCAASVEHHEQRIADLEELISSNNTNADASASKTEEPDHTHDQQVEQVMVTEDSWQMTEWMIWSSVAVGLAVAGMCVWAWHLCRSSSTTIMKRIAFVIFVSVTLKSALFVALAVRFFNEALMIATESDDFLNDSKPVILVLFLLLCGVGDRVLTRFIPRVPKAGGQNGGTAGSPNVMVEPDMGTVWAIFAIETVLTMVALFLAVTLWLVTSSSGGMDVSVAVSMMWLELVAASGLFLGRCTGLDLMERVKKGGRAVCAGVSSLANTMLVVALGRYPGSPAQDTAPVSTSKPSGVVSRGDPL